MCDVARRWAVVLVYAAGWLWSYPAFPHAVGETYVFMSIREEALAGHVEIHERELAAMWDIDLPRSEDQALARLRESKHLVEPYILEHFVVTVPGGEHAQPSFERIELLSTEATGRFAKYHFYAPVSAPLPDELTVRQDLFLETSPLHRNLLLLEYNAKTGRRYDGEHTVLIFSRATPVQRLDLVDVPTMMRPLDFVKAGVYHILIGYDHVLFILCLLLPAVLALDAGRWIPADRFGTSMWQVIKIVTVFTVAHSVTLTLAALGLVSVSSRWVESAIALSIVVVALNNICPILRGHAWPVVFVFGLFHGLGFATVMGHLEFRIVDLVKTMIAFNVGVELGQIAIVAAIFPLLHVSRKKRFFQPLVLRGGSSLMAVLASFWFVQRAF